MFYNFQGGTYKSRVVLDSVDQSLLWNQVDSFANITNVQPLFFSGAIAGSEFLTYAVIKLYVCYSVFISLIDAENTLIPNIIFFDQANNPFINVQKSSLMYESVAADTYFSGQPIKMENFYFSRFDIIGYQSIIFRGFRLTY